MAEFQKQEAEQLFTAGFYNPDAVRQKARRILVLKTAVAGLRMQAKNVSDDMKELTKPGTELKLYREPTNKHDEWAIEIRTVNDKKIGYVTRFKNEAIARLMDAGKKFVAEVDEPIAHDDFKTIEHKAPTENYDLPFSVYLVE